MKKMSFILCIIILSLTACEGVPSSPSEDHDVWGMLERGDSRVSSFFIGEVDVNAVDSRGRTPLHYAAERGDTQLAILFISLGANVNALDNSNQSPLGISTGRGDPGVTGVLANAGADIHLPILGNTSAANMALNADGNVLRAILTPQVLDAVDSDNRNILHLAVIQGNFQAVSIILSDLQSMNAALINRQDAGRKNALDYALDRPDSLDHIRIAELLILRGANSNNPINSYLAPSVRSANYNIRRSDGLAPIHHAVMENHIGLLRFLFEKNIDINIQSFSGSTALHEAARSGNLRIMTMLLDNGADVNATDARGNTALHIGIPLDVHRDAIALLLERDAIPNMRDEHGDTPLHIVIMLNRPMNVVQTLLGGGSDVHVRNIQGQTPLYISVQEKREDLIPLLLSYGSDVFAVDNSGVTPFDIAMQDDALFNLIVTVDTVTQKDSAGNTMLHIAVRNRGIPRHIGFILDHRAPVDARNMDGDTALHFAVRLNQSENGEFLISRGASIFSVNAEGISPLYLAFTSDGGIRRWMINPTTIIARDGLGNNMLHYASQWGLDNVIPVIINSGASVEERNATGETPLFMATKNDSPSTIRVLINNRANLNVRDNQGNSLLHTAVRWNTINSANALLSSGININAHSMNGNTALHDAIILGMTEIEDLLITNGANLEARDDEGNTPLMEAVRVGSFPSAEKLITNGANASTRNTRGDTPLHLAVSMERIDLVNILLNRGASIHARNTLNRTPFQYSIHLSTQMLTLLLSSGRINIQDDLGNSVLHIAVHERASDDIIRLLINLRAVINAVDNNGQTPLRHALDSGLLETAKILSDSGADPFLAAVDNKSPADVAFENGIDYVRALFSGRAINARDNLSNTVLHMAARFGTPEIIEMLIELGANLTLRNISSQTPFDVAVLWNKSENAELLR